MYQQHDQASYKTNLQESNNEIARLGLKLGIVISLQAYWISDIDITFSDMKYQGLLHLHSFIWNL